MLHIKDLPLDERKSPQYREHHLTLVLLMLLGVSVLPSAHRLLGGIQAFSALLSVPVFSLLCGRMSRGLEKDLRTDRLSAVGLAALYATSTLPGFWMAALARKEAVFDLLSPACATGLFLFCSLALPVAAWMEERRLPKRTILVLSLLLGLAAGYVPGPANPLGLRQLVSFLPLFLVGRWVNPEALEGLLKRMWLKIAGAAALLALLLVCFWKWKKLLDWGLVLMAGDAYGTVGLGKLGAAMRLAQYAAALLATLSLLSLSPNRPLKFVTALSQRWYSGLFWHQGAAYLLCALPLLRSGGMMALLRTALSGVAPVLCCIPLGAVLPNWLLDLPQHLKDEHAILKIKRRRGMSLHFVLYSLVFLLLLSQFASSFVETGHTMTWVPDGENLYIVMMYYARNYFMGVFKTLLRTHRLVFPQWDFSIGQGASVLSVLRLNPFYLLSLPFPKKWMDYVYALYCLGQLFCAALAFAALCRSLGQKDELSIFTGSLVYAFGGYALFTAAKHVYFVTYLVLALPLLLLGCERYLQHKKWGLFVAVVFCLFLSGYYYAWMDSLLMAIYLLAREIYHYREDFRKILFDLVRLVALYLWGMALSMFFLLPSILALFSSSRSDSLGTGVSLLYAPVHYKKLLVNLVSLDPTAQNWTRLGFVGTVFLALVVLFLRRRWELRPFKVLTGLFALFLCIPAVGSVFNGLGYATNRWSFGLALLMSLIFVWMLPELARLDSREQMIVGLASLIYSAVVLILDHSLVTVYSVLLLLLLTLTVLLVNRIHDQRMAQQLIAGATVAALLVHVGFFFSPGGLNNVEDYTETGSGAKKYSASAEAALTGLEDTLYRGEHNGNRHNSFCLTGGNGTCTYWSVLDGAMVDFHQDFELDSLHQLYAIWGLDQRASLCALGSVKYYTSKTPDQVPFGFEDAGPSKKTKHTLFKNRYALPFGYTYTSYLPQEAYDALSPLEKQQAILQSAVVRPEDEETLGAYLEQGEPELNTISVPWSPGEADGVELEDNRFHVTKKDAVITLNFQGQPGCETYLWLRGAAYEKGASESTVTVQGQGGGEKKSDFYQENTLYYFPRSGYTYNLGYSENGMTSCTIRFEQKGWYSAEDIQIVCLPMADYVRDVTALGEVVLEDAKETLNGGLTGHIESPDTRLLVFSVPRSRGWRLCLNGTKTPLLDVNGMYMGVVLAPGSYDVELRYSTPGFVPGLVISCAAALVLAAHWVLWLVERKKH